jgi:ABC-type bacteriocin/lantibiotic exporter with double-glycine peptidase domain
MLPLFQVALQLFSSRRSREAFGRRHNAQFGFIEQMNSVMADFHLISDFRKKPEALDNCQSVIKRNKEASDAVQRVVATGSYLSQWLGTLLVVLQVMVGGREVCAGDLSVGTFAAEVVAFILQSYTCSQIARIVLELQDIEAPLQRVTSMLNCVTDLDERMRLNRHRRRKQQLLRAELQTDALFGLHLDELPILFENVNFTYYGRGSSSRRFNWQGTMHIEQGTFVSLIGPKGEGKATLLKIMGDAVLPPSKLMQKEVLFVPMHLRVLHILNKEMFYRGTLYEALTFGVNPGNPDGDKTRVKKICSKLGLPESVVHFIDTEDRLPWGEVLSRTQCSLLSIACGLVANPEVLLIHKPTEALDAVTAACVLKQLRAFVDGKGVVQDAQKEHMRKPRTCIITCSRLMAVDLSDQVFHVSTSQGMTTLSKEEVTLDMLG